MPTGFALCKPCDLQPRSRSLKMVQTGRSQWCLNTWQVWKNLVGKFAHNVQCKSFCHTRWTDGQITASWLASCPNGCTNMTDYMDPYFTIMDIKKDCSTTLKWSNMSKYIFSFVSDILYHVACLMSWGKNVHLMYSITICSCLYKLSVFPWWKGDLAKVHHAAIRTYSIPPPPPTSSPKTSSHKLLLQSLGDFACISWW